MLSWFQGNQKFQMLVKNVNDQFKLERIIFYRKTDIYPILSGGGETVNNDTVG